MENFDYKNYIAKNPLLKESVKGGDTVILTRDVSTKLSNFKKGDEMEVISIPSRDTQGYKLRSPKGTVWGMDETDFQPKDENFDKPLNEVYSKDDLFDSWREGELEVGNTILKDITSPDDLDGDNKVSYEKYVEVINKYPNLNLHDTAAAVSSILFGVGEYEDFDFEELSKDEFDQIKELIQ